MLVASSSSNNGCSSSTGQVVPAAARVEQGHVEVGEVALDELVDLVRDAVFPVNAFLAYFYLRDRTKF